MSLWKRKKKRKNISGTEAKPIFSGLTGGAGDAPKDPPGDSFQTAPGGEDDDNNDDGYQQQLRRPRFIKTNEEDYQDNPVEIVNVLINGLKAQGISADKFCEITGFHKNTISKWKRSVTEPPEWIGFLFKVLIMHMQSGANMKEFLQSVEDYQI